MPWGYGWTPELTLRLLRSLYILDPATFGMIYGPDERRDIESRVTMLAEPQSRQSIAADPSLLSGVQAIFSGWGAPLMDEAFLDAAPNLEVVFYAAGAVGSWMTDSVWERGVRVSSAYAANAVPVSEYTLASILLSLKYAWALSRGTRASKTFLPRDGAPGCYGSVVGLVSLGAIGQRVLSLLRPFDLKVRVYDPFLSPADASAMNVESVSLEALFAQSDVVSIHTPDLPETLGLITGRLINSMKPGAALINTARGQVIREDEMIAVLTRRDDLQAILDVTQVEPPVSDSPLYTLPNVMLTPHIAGSVGNECRRMGRYMVEELARYLADQPLKWEITPQLAAKSSHRPMRSGRRGPAENIVAITA